MSRSRNPRLAVSVVVASAVVSNVAILIAGGFIGPARAGDQNPLATDIPSFQPFWSELLPPVSQPVGRHVHTFTFDPIRREAILFGGFAGGAPFGDAWKLSLGAEPAWTQISSSGSPAARRGHSMIYDPVRDRMVLFGGYSGTYRNDTWQLSLGSAPAWTQLTTTGNPPASNWHSAIYDPVRDAMVVFGGINPDTDLRNQTWVLSFATMAWTLLEPAGALPEPRFGHTAVYDAIADRMIVFGGRNPDFANDVWALSLASPEWTRFLPAAPLPQAREGAPGIFDPVENRLIVFGGWDDATTRNDTWAFSFVTSAWLDVSPSVRPPTRSGSAAIYDPVQDRMIIFGGNSTLARNDTWAMRWLKRPIRPTIDPGDKVQAAAASAPKFALMALPNPSSDRISISFSLPAAGRVSLDVFDISGRRVRSLIDGQLPTGAHEMTWNGDNAHGNTVAAGTYFLRLTSSHGEQLTKRVTLVR